MAYTCAVKNCSNGSYWLNKWKKQQLCSECGCLHKDKEYILSGKYVVR